MFKNTVLFIVLIGISCAGKVKGEKSDFQSKKNTLPELNAKQNKVVVGANRIEEYLPILKGKRVGIVANQTSVIFKNEEQQEGKTTFTHLVDSLLSLEVNIKKVFAPEHGFRGKADAGEIVKDGIDTKTGLPIISLYGQNKKPSIDQLIDIDILVFDIQDVGARFYTYISSLHYVMEACAEQNTPILILDRPNPNGHYIDGPILETAHKSFIGMHPIPIVHGMTIGEYAQMINGEDWLKNKIKAQLTIIPIKHYNRKNVYSLPIKPSPNLPNDMSINLYPSLCLFEGTNVSVGRGTEMQFQILGSPFLKSEKYDFKFTPQPNEGAKRPKYEGEICYGYDLSNTKKLSEIQLNWLIEFYEANKQHAKYQKFFTDFFTKLAGTKQLQKQIEEGKTSSEIKESWKEGLDRFNQMRQKYLIYDGS